MHIMWKRLKENLKKSIMELYRYRYEMAIEQNKNMVEDNLERTERLENADTLHNSDNNTEL